MTEARRPVGTKAHQQAYFAHMLRGGDSLAVSVALAVVLSGCSGEDSRSLEQRAMDACWEAVVERVGVDELAEETRAGRRVAHWLTNARPGDWMATGRAAPDGWNMRGLTVAVPGKVEATNFECRVDRDSATSSGVRVAQVLLCRAADQHPWGCTDPTKRFS